MGSQSALRLGEVARHRDAASCWLVVHGRVLDVTKFLDSHPGGAEAILDYAGKDGTQAFEDVGHSAAAIEEMKTLQIGVVHPDDLKTNPIDNATLIKWSLLGLAIAIIAGVVVKRYLL